MANTEFGKDKIKRVICLVLIFGGFAILHNFVPEGLDQAGWDGFLVLFGTSLADRGGPHGGHIHIRFVLRRMGRL